MPGKIGTPQKEGIIRGIQHNTYDIEFHGPNTMIGSFYLGALRAAEEISKILGENEKAKEYHKIFESGQVGMENELFQEDFFHSKNSGLSRFSFKKVLLFQFVFYFPRQFRAKIPVWNRMSF